MREAGQDYRVRKIPLVGVPGGESDTVGCDTHMMLIREDTGAMLSITSAEWPVAQNADAYAFLAPLVEAGFCSINTAGTLFDGRRCFVLAKTEEGFQLPGGDENEGYVLVQISQVTDEDGNHLYWDNDYVESDEEMMARHPELRGRDGKLVPMLNLDFPDPNDTRPVDEGRKTDLANHASVPQADELVKAFDISTD